MERCVLWCFVTCDLKKQLVTYKTAHMVGSEGIESRKVGGILHSGLMFLLCAISSQAFHWPNQPETLLASLLGEKARWRRVGIEMQNSNHRFPWPKSLEKLNSSEDTELYGVMIVAYMFSS